ncbi:MAG: transporter substrate-binding domain-containing protein [Bermanella sp.]
MPLRPLILALALLFNLSYTSAQECEQLTVSGSNQWRPIAYSNPDKTQALGIAYDVTQALADALNLTISFNVKMPWARAIKMLDDGEIDMMAGVYWTKQRKDQYLFTLPVTNDTLNIFVKRGKEFNYQKFKDLAGKKLDLIRGTSLGNKFDSYILEHLEMSEVNTFKQQLARLNIGRSDIVVLDPFTAASVLKELNLSKEIVMLDTPIAVNPVHLIFSKKSPCVKHLDAMNRLIEKMQRNGRLAKIRDAYL